MAPASPGTTSTIRRWFDRRRGVLVRGALLLALLCSSRVVHRYFEDRANLHTGTAEWIWWSDDLRKPEPIAFVVQRSFTLPRMPRWAVAKCAGDEEYVLYVNGRKVGSNRWLPGAPVDLYDIGQWLHQGENHISVELRSATGAGGLLFALDADGLPRNGIVSDRSWRWSRQLKVRWLRVPDNGGWEPAASWGRPPFHPWGYPAAPRRRPDFADLSRRGTLPVAGAATLGDDEHPAAPVRLAGPPLLFEEPLVLDFGREVAGYLILYVDDRAFRGTAVTFHLTPPRPGDTVPESRRAVASAPELKGFYDDAVARRFRYVVVERPRGLTSAAVVELDERWVAAAPS